MKYLKIFEEYQPDQGLKNEILSKLRGLISDIIDISLERLDEITERGKSIVFDVNIEDNKGYITGIINARFNPENDFSDDDIIWITNNKFNYPTDDEALDILSLLNKDGQLQVTISVVYDDEDGDLKALPCGDILNRLGEAYPDIEFTTFAPWDLN